MSALSAEGYRHYHPNDVSTTTRMMSLSSCVKYSKPLSCMSKTIRAMFVVQYHYHQSGVGITIQAMSALSSGQCRRCHQAGVGHVSPRLSAFLMAFLSYIYGRSHFYGALATIFLSHHTLRSKPPYIASFHHVRPLPTASLATKLSYIGLLQSATSIALLHI